MHVKKKGTASVKRTNRRTTSGKTIRARFSDGVLTPLEPLALDEGEEVTLTVAGSKGVASPDWLEGSAGSWAGLVDAEKLIRDIYESRFIQTRPLPRL
jgi:predicted DNA-binding antitoxin AbrB/MazE fold protein